MFEELKQIHNRPKSFEYYTAGDLWTDAYTSEQMLAYHLNEDIDVSSRKGAFIDRSVEWIVSHFGVGAGTKIADFGCGPGLYAARLAQKQAAITGIDFSARSIDYAQQEAQQRGLSIDYVHQNYLEYETKEHFDLILMIMCDFCALSPVQRKHMLEAFRRFLTDDGAILLDVYSLKAFALRKEAVVCQENLLDGFWSGEKYYGFLNTFKYEQEKVVLDKYTIIEARRTRTIYNWLQYFSPESLESEFAACGLKVEDFYGDVAGAVFDPEGTEFAVVARANSSVT